MYKRQPYGQATLASTGAAPVALAMAYVAATGDTTYTPVEFAQWATDHDLTAAGVDKMCIRDSLRSRVVLAVLGGVGDGVVHEVDAALVHRCV